MQVVGRDHRDQIGPFPGEHLAIVAVDAELRPTAAPTFEETFPSRRNDVAACNELNVGNRRHGRRVTARQRSAYDGIRGGTRRIGRDPAQPNERGPILHAISAAVIPTSACGTQPSGRAGDFCQPCLPGAHASIGTGRPCPGLSTTYNDGVGAGSVVAV